MSERGLGWLRRYIASASGAWKVAACFLLGVFGLIVLIALATLAGWHQVSYRLFAYLCLAVVGFFISLLIHAYISIRGSMRARLQEHQVGYARRQENHDANEDS